MRLEYILFGTVSISEVVVVAGVLFLIFVIGVLFRRMLLQSKQVPAVRQFEYMPHANDAESIIETGGESVRVVQGATENAERLFCLLLLKNNIPCESFAPQNNLRRDIYVPKDRVKDALYILNEAVREDD